MTGPAIASTQTRTIITIYGHITLDSTPLDKVIMSCNGIVIITIYGHITLDSTPSRSCHRHNPRRGSSLLRGLCVHGDGLSRSAATANGGGAGGRGGHREPRVARPGFDTTGFLHPAVAHGCGCRLLARARGTQEAVFGRREGGGTQEDRERPGKNRAASRHASREGTGPGRNRFLFLAPQGDTPVRITHFRVVIRSASLAEGSAPLS